MPRKPILSTEEVTRYYSQREVNGYGVAYWVVLDRDNDYEAIPGRMPDEQAAKDVALLLNRGGERRSCAKSHDIK